jgi:hypothetical protein
VDRRDVLLVPSRRQFEASAAAALRTAAADAAKAVVAEARGVQRASAVLGRTAQQHRAAAARYRRVAGAAERLSGADRGELPGMDAPAGAVRWSPPRAPAIPVLAKVRTDIVERLRLRCLTLVDHLVETALALALAEAALYLDWVALRDQMYRYRLLRRRVLRGPDAPAAHLICPAARAAPRPPQLLIARVRAVPEIPEHSPTRLSPAAAAATAWDLVLSAAAGYDTACGVRRNALGGYRSAWGGLAAVVGVAPTGWLPDPREARRPKITETGRKG